MAETEATGVKDDGNDDDLFDPKDGGDGLRPCGKACSA